jgi:hypothetical protein
VQIQHLVSRGISMMPSIDDASGSGGPSASSAELLRTPQQMASILLKKMSGEGEAALEGGHFWENLFSLGTRQILNRTI